MTNNCKYCNKEFKSSQSRSCHYKKSSQFCDKIRLKQTCNICNTILLYGDSMFSHQQLCRQDSVEFKTIETVKQEYEHQISRIETGKQRDVEQLQKELQELKLQIKLLENDKQRDKEQIKTFKEMYENLAEKCALKDTTSTTTINNNSKNTFNQVVQLLETGGPINLNKERIEHIFNTNYTERDFRKGIEGLADFTAKHIIKNDDGHPTYAVTDRSRNKYKYMDDNGSIVNDSNAEIILNAINGPAINKIRTDIWNPENTFVPPEHEHDYSYEYDKYTSMRDTYNSIDGMVGNPIPFCSKLSKNI